MLDTRKALRQQLILVAVVTATADTGAFVLSGIFAVAPLKAMVFAPLIAGAGLLLCVPARFSGFVWVIAGVVQLSGAWAFQPDPVAPALATGAFLIAGYLAGAWLRGWRCAITVFVVVSEIVVKDIVLGDVRAATLGAWLVSLATWSGLPFLVGRYTAAQRAYTAGLEHRLEQRRLVELAALDHALADERSAIARDLHDVISHHVSAIGIHAGAARIALSSGASSTKISTSLAAVETSSRSAMADLQRQLDLLHGSSSDGRRQPGLANLDHVLENVRAAGLHTEVRMHGQLPTIAESLDVALYRIVQELLTNALKHGAGQASVDLTCTPDEVTISQGNPIRTVAAAHALPSTGRGLTGIEQRAALFGGHVQYGPDVAGTHWQVTVAIPLEQI